MNTLLKLLLFAFVVAIFVSLIHIDMMMKIDEFEKQRLVDSTMNYKLKHPIK